jgi:hypothetical protein
MVLPDPGAFFLFLFKERFPYCTNWCPHGLEDSLYATVSFQGGFILGVRDFSNAFVTCGRPETTSVPSLPLTPCLSGLKSEVEDSICGKYGEWVWPHQLLLHKACLDIHVPRSRKDFASSNPRLRNESSFSLGIMRLYFKLHYLPALSHLRQSEQSTSRYGTLCQGCHYQDPSQLIG